MHDFVQNISVDATEVELFKTYGFLVKENVLSSTAVEALRERFGPLFRGEFETGVYPDEWYWRERMSLPDVTRHMSNAWKADLTVARLVLSEGIARAAASLAGWDAVRLGQDTIWWKPAKTRSIAYHQDTSFMDFLEPAKTLTCWIALDDTRRDAGTLEYAPGSHRWPVTALPKAFHAEDDYRSPMLDAASEAGFSPPEPVYVEVAAGSCAFHAGETWHGSGPNLSSETMRRSIGIHLLPESARFSNRKGGYIYRRYQLTGDSQLNESFFPVVWTNRGYRSDWIDAYLGEGVRY